MGFREGVLCVEDKGDAMSADVGVGFWIPVFVMIFVFTDKAF